MIYLVRIQSHQFNFAECFSRNLRNSFRDNCAVYILPVVNYCAALWAYAHRARVARARSGMRACIYAPAYVCILCARVTESLTLGAHGSHNAVYGHYGHCATRERMNMCTMHQRVKTQWRTTQTPELRRQSA